MLLLDQELNLPTRFRDPYGAPCTPSSSSRIVPISWTGLHVLGASDAPGGVAVAEEEVESGLSSTTTVLTSSPSPSCPSEEGISPLTPSPSEQCHTNVSLASTAPPASPPHTQAASCRAPLPWRSKRKSHPVVAAEHPPPIPYRISLTPTDKLYTTDIAYVNALSEGRRWQKAVYAMGSEDDKPVVPPLKEFPTWLALAFTLELPKHPPHGGKPRSIVPSAPQSHLLPSGANAPNVHALAASAATMTKPMMIMKESSKAPPTLPVSSLTNLIISQC